MCSNMVDIKGIDDALVAGADIKVNDFDTSKKIIEKAFLKTQLREVCWEGELSDEIEKDIEIKKWGKIKTLPKVVEDAQSFLPEDIPSFAREYCIAVSNSMQAPIEYMLVSLITLISSLIGIKVQMQPKKHDDSWKVSVNLWGLLIGPPSSFKSPMMRYILSFLDPHIKKIREKYLERLQEFKAVEKSLKAKIKGLEEGIKNETKKVEKDYEKIERYEKELLKLERELDDRTPYEDRFMANDITIEALLQILSKVGNCILVFKDEYAGLLSGFSKKGRETERTTYMEGFNGNLSIRVDRVGREDDHAENVAISLLGSIQPGVLNKYIFKAYNAGDGNDGFIERHQLMVYPKVSKDFEYVDEKIPQESQSKVQKIIDKLISLRSSLSEPIVLSFDEESLEFYSEWYVNLFKRIRKGEEENVSKHFSHLGKYNAFLPSLALIFHVCDTLEQGGEIQNTEVSLKATKLAARWCEILEEHAVKIYSYTDNQELVRAQSLLELIKTGKVRSGHPIRELYRRGLKNLKNSSDVKTAIKILEQHNIAREEKIIKSKGAPTYVLEINPEVYDVL